METTTHLRLGVVTVLGVQALGLAPHLTVPGTLLAGGAAAVFAGGKLSPDMDNQPMWKRWHVIRPLGHRRLTHWWGLPALAALGWLALGPEIPGLAFAAVLGAWIGWCSHLVGDAFFGARNPVYDLPKGVPLAPWWAHIGTGWHCGHWGEKAVSVLLAVAAVALLGWLAVDSLGTVHIPL